MPARGGPILAALAIAALASQLSPTNGKATRASAGLSTALSNASVPATLDARPGLDGDFELTMHLNADSDLPEVLDRVGASASDARMLVTRLRESGSTFGDADVRLTLGGKIGDGRRIVRLIRITESGARTFSRTANGFALTDRSTIRRLGFSNGPHLYWQARRESLQPVEIDKLQKFAQTIPSGGSISAVINEREGRFGGRDQPELLFLEGRTRAGTLSRSLKLSDGRWVNLDRAQQTMMLQPVPGRITSGFGTRWHPILEFFRPHRGVDFAAAFGQPVMAAADGVIESAGWRGGYGKQVRIGHASALESSYSHLSGVAVTPGQYVNKGEIIGYAGASGLATGPHLHFEVYRNGIAVNPLGASLGVNGDPLKRPDVQSRLRELGLSLG